MSTAQDLPLAYAEPLQAAPALRLVPVQPLDFDDAVRRVRPRLHRYAVRRLGDLHEAEELVQEALLRAYSHREQLLTEEDLSAWTTVVTGRLVIDRLRVRGRSTSVAEVPENARMGRDTADVVVARDEARTALDALDAMPTRQASLLWAREVEGQSYEELGQRFGMTEPAVRSVLTRARKALRKEYALRGGTLPVGGLAVLAPWVAGLSWAGKLRAAVSRVSGPAALATIGVTTLGGLILSPFGTAPSTSTGTFRPSQAVVLAAAPATDTAARPFAAVRTPGRAATLGSAVTTTPVSHGQPGLNTPGLKPIDHFNCDGPLLAVPGPTTLPTGGLSVPKDLDASGTSCSQARGSEVVIGPDAPANPTGVKHAGIQQDVVACPQTPSNPLVSCHPVAQQGASK